MAQWTKRHQEICLEEKLPPAAVHLWQWLNRRSKYEALEVDLKNFNKFIEKKRLVPYHRETVKSAIARLVEIGVIVGRKIGGYWNIWDLEVLDPSRKFEPAQEKEGSEPAPETTESVSEAEQQKNVFMQQQPLIARLLEEHGIPISQDLVKRYHFRDLEEWKSAIVLFYCRGGHKDIGNPVGWLSQCLKYRWWEEQLVVGSFAECIVKRFQDEAEEILKKCHSLLGIVKWDGNLLEALGVRLC